MPVYVIAQMEVRDVEMYRDYATKVPASFAAHGGKFLTATDTAEVLEGTQPFPRTVLGQFPSMEAAKTWYASDEYQAILPLRTQSTNGTLFMVEGFSMPEASDE
jgi:uncharacterized protein (DUF1330 family)